MNQILSYMRMLFFLNYDERIHTIILNHFILPVNFIRNSNTPNSSMALIFVENHLDVQQLNTILLQLSTI